VEVLDDAHADDVDDLALIARHPLVEKGEVGAFHRGEAGDMAPLHLLRRDGRRRLALQAGIDIGHGVPPLNAVSLRAKRSNLDPVALRPTRLLRRCAPRNDNQNLRPLSRPRTVVQLADHIGERLAPRPWGDPADLASMAAI